MNITLAPEESDAVVVLNNDDLHAAITPSPDGGFSLTWNDHVTNDWAETHPSLSAALVRLAEIVA